MATRLFPEHAYGSPMPDFELDADGLRLLQSALHTPRHPYYRTVHEKAACLFRSLCKNHPLKDGNKRLAVVALMVFLNINKVDFRASQDAIVDAALTVAAHRGNYPLQVITGWIRAGCRGRPRHLVTAIAETWEVSSRETMVNVRRGDVQAGRHARIPGRRVGMSSVVRRKLGGLRVTPRRSIRLTLKDGPRDGQEVLLGPGFAMPEIGSLFLIANRDSSGPGEHLRYEVIGKRRGPEVIARFVGAVPFPLPEPQT
jgi:death-on-curing protein